MKKKKKKKKKKRFYFSKKFQIWILRNFYGRIVVDPNSLKYCMFRLHDKFKMISCSSLITERVGRRST